MARKKKHEGFCFLFFYTRSNRWSRPQIRPQILPCPSGRGQQRGQNLLHEKSPKWEVFIRYTALCRWDCAVLFLRLTKKKKKNTEGFIRGFSFRPWFLQMDGGGGRETSGAAAVGHSRTRTVRESNQHTHTHTHFHTSALRPFCFSVSEGFTASHDRFFTEPRRSSWCTTSRPLRASLLSPTGPAVSRYHVSTAGPCRLQPWGHVHKPVKIFKRNLFAAIATRPLEGAPPNTLETPHLIKARFSTEWKCWLPVNTQSFLFVFFRRERLQTSPFYFWGIKTIVKNDRWKPRRESFSPRSGDLTVGLSALAVSRFSRRVFVCFFIADFSLYRGFLCNIKFLISNIFISFVIKYVFSSLRRKKKSSYIQK